MKPVSALESRRHSRECPQEMRFAMATIYEKTGRVFWITGFSGAGKTTLGLKLQEQLRASGINAVLLDGDRLRSAIAPDAGHTTDDRFKLAFAYARLCRELAEQGIVLICATISMFHAVREWSRQNIPGYREIYLRVPIEQRLARDPKGLYRQKTPNMSGLDQALEIPSSPDLILDNFGELTIEQAVNLIWNKLVISDGKLFGETSTAS